MAINEISKEDMCEIFYFLEKLSLPAEKDLIATIDENNVVSISRQDGSIKYRMPEDVYFDLIDYKP